MNQKKSTTNIEEGHGFFECENPAHRVGGFYYEEDAQLFHHIGEHLLWSRLPMCTCGGLMKWVAEEKKKELYE